MIPREQITGLILAGGRGRRMGGDDKGLQPFRGKPLIAHVIERVRPQVATLLISANRHLDEYRAWGWPVVPDRWDDFRGPLAGLASVIARVETPYILVSPCDTPFLPAQLAPRLAAALRGEQADAAVVVSAGMLQPLCVLLRRELETSLTEYRARGGASAQDWLRQCRVVEVEFDDEPHAFLNLNTARELTAAS